LNLAVRVSEKCREKKEPPEAEDTHCKKTKVFPLGERKKSAPCQQ